MNKSSGNKLTALKLQFMIILFVLTFLSCSYAETPSANVTADSETVVSKGAMIKDVNGLRLAIPKDMPVVKRGSFVVPMSTEEYVSIKFSNLESRLGKIEEVIAKINQDLTSVKETIQSLHNPPPVSVGLEKSNTPALKDLKE